MISRALPPCKPQGGQGPKAQAATRHCIATGTEVALACIFIHEAAREVREALGWKRRGRRLAAEGHSRPTAGNRALRSRATPGPPQGTGPSGQGLPQEELHCDEGAPMAKRGPCEAEGSRSRGEGRGPGASWRGPGGSSSEPSRPSGGPAGSEGPMSLRPLMICLISRPSRHSWQHATTKS